MIELLDLRKGNIHLGAPRALARGDHLRQAVQGLRAEHQVHVWRAPHNLPAFLARDTSSDSNQEIGIVLFQMPDAPKVVKHLFLRFFPYRTSIEKDDVRFRGIVRLFHLLRDAKNVGHLFRVVLVHLTAKGLDIEFLDQEFTQFEIEYPVSDSNP